MLTQSRAPRYSPQDQLVWKVLFDRQTALLHRRAVPAFSAAVAQLGLRREAIPDLPALSAEVFRRSGWQLVPVGQSLGPEVFFKYLAERQFPVMTRIRPMRDFDFSPEPDLFHDLFGHVPMLLDAHFADFLHTLGLAAQALCPDDAVARRELWALYFFTAEFGLVLHDGKPHLYGAGLLSSAGEIHHCVNEATPRPAFDVETVRRTPVLGTRFQDQYFVLPTWEELAECAGELAGLLVPVSHRTAA
ncbi:phenylalanine-4-hydroxylase [Hymenobacter nivis]|uniref:Phenylalanine-4-hydroxylase n=1 Tax=Hymenobacter nivis TaxID=1850093 RepID=A0A502GLA1_9BACT|nr:phenylalanine-4-hydroxylase [Hymenobacter nivis]TPG61766.1 phenylalanine-4-hydroxylase [Hymenobacter nivis]